MGETGARTNTMGELVLPVEGELPPLTGLGPWFNSAAADPRAAAGKVVVIDFWTYSCINCLRSIPYVKAWDERYRKDGLVVIGVHAPEFAFEREPANVGRSKDLGIRYPVALDNNYVLWRAFKNNYWPAHYFVDAQGRVRYHHFGEGDYDVSERVIRQLLAEAGHAPAGQPMPQVTATGAQAAAAIREIGSPETYVGYARADVSSRPAGSCTTRQRPMPPRPCRSTTGRSKGNGVTAGKALVRFARERRSASASTRATCISCSVRQRKPVRFRVTLDGKAPGRDAGVDSTPTASGTVPEQRLYQLVRQKGAVRDRTFTIEFLDPGVEAFAFTFG